MRRCLSNLSNVDTNISIPDANIYFSSTYDYSVNNTPDFNLILCEYVFIISFVYNTNSLEGTNIITRGRLGYVNIELTYLSYFFKLCIIGSKYANVLPVPVGAQKYIFFSVFNTSGITKFYTGVGV